jgi:predicted small integral membrane protein
VTLRLAKILLLAGIALLHTLIVFNNVTDHHSNLLFVQHVLAMDTTFPANHGMWRAIHSHLADEVFYLVVICWEALAAAVCWAGAACLAAARRKSALDFNQAKRVAIFGLTSSLLLWLIAFLAVGGEWFLMWQSKAWNGQEAAGRVFAVVGVVLILMAMPDTETQP